MKYGIPPSDPKEERVHCDNVGCEESYPRFHKERGPGFTAGRWVGWFYLDLNRPHLSARALRFCGMRCLLWWLSEAVIPYPNDIDRETSHQETARNLLMIGGNGQKRDRR